MSQLCLRHAHSHDPLHATVERLLALVLILDGKYKEALPIAEDAVKTKEMGYYPNAPGDDFYMTLGLPHFMMEQYEEAIAALEKSIRWPDYIYGRISLTAAYGLAGSMEEACAQAQEVLGINPNITLEDIAKNGYYNFQKAEKERFISALRKAGLS